jgi:integrase
MRNLSLTFFILSSLVVVCRRSGSAQSASAAVAITEISADLGTCYALITVTGTDSKPIYSAKVNTRTFRHTYRSWLDDTGAPMGVQQKLMRHAQISTTMNVYGNALMTAKREANSKVVRMALRSA